MMPKRRRIRKVQKEVFLLIINVFIKEKEKKEEEDDDDEFLNSMINQNKAEEEKLNQEKLKQDDDISQVFNIIGKDAVISKLRFQDNSHIRLLNNWQEGETRQT